MGGPHLSDAGAEVLVDYRALSVVGLVEVAHHAKQIYRAWQTLTAYLRLNRPDVVVLVDFPDFNFLLARTAKRFGLKIFYYISPQVWAWRSGRVRTIRRYVDKMAVILPFEVDFYRRHRLEVEFVGHPLLDVLASPPSRPEMLHRYRPDASSTLIGLLPGSRASELRLLLGLMLDAASLLREQFPHLSFLLPVAASLDPSRFEPELRQRNLPVRLVIGDTYGAVTACELILTVSGTATLEAAILGTPMIIVNRISTPSYLLGRHLIKVNCVGLPNLIAGRMMVPELLQREANPERIAAEATAMLRKPGRLVRQREDLAQIRSRLGEPGVALRVAELVLQTAG
jgi:lipid-A-disaccharide synthase